MIAAPLKPEYRHPPATWLAKFRDHMIAAPLKHVLFGNCRPVLLQFRDHMIAAPLKLNRLLFAVLFVVVIPRSHDRGPIEATIWAISARLTPEIPRSHDRGPIEARSERRLCRGCPRQFRDHMIAAPLKPAGWGAPAPVVMNSAIT